MAPCAQKPRETGEVLNGFPYSAIFRDALPLYKILSGFACIPLVPGIFDLVLFSGFQTAPKTGSQPTAASLATKLVSSGRWYTN